MGYRVGGVGETYLEEERDERLDEENLENWTPDEHEHAAEAEIDEPEALLAVLVVRHDIRADDRVESGRGVETRRLGVCHLSLSLSLSLGIIICIVETVVGRRAGLVFRKQPRALPSGSSFTAWTLAAGRPSNTDRRQGLFHALEPPFRTSRCESRPAAISGLGGAASRGCLPSGRAGRAPA